MRKRGRMDSSLGVIAVIIADDLTGACDAGVHFAMRGLRAQVLIGPDVDATWQAQVISWNTYTRCSEASSLAARLELAVKLARDSRPTLLMKKIDSTLRGPIGLEIAWILEKLELPLAIVAPASPQAGRLVWEGRVLLRGSNFAMDVAACLPRLKCAHVSRDEIGLLGDLIEEEMRRGTKALIVDAEDDVDLSRLACLRRQVPKVLWTGSGGLARALAMELAGDLRPVTPRAAGGPVLICVGSDHSVTAAQLRHLEQQVEVARVFADQNGYATAKAALARGVDVVLEFPRATIEAVPDGELADKVGVLHCGSLVATGGDTALFVLRSMQAHSITLGAEIEPGIPWGRIKGGAADGKLLVTKSGGFGGSGALVACVDFLDPFAARGKKAKPW